MPWLNKSTANRAILSRDSTCWKIHKFGISADRSSADYIPSLFPCNRYYRFKEYKYRKYRAIQRPKRVRNRVRIWFAMKRPLIKIGKSTPLNIISDSFQLFKHFSIAQVLAFRYPRIEQHARTTQFSDTLEFSSFFFFFFLRLFYVFLFFAFLCVSLRFTFCVYTCLCFTWFNSNFCLRNLLYTSKYFIVYKFGHICQANRKTF